MEMSEFLEYYEVPVVQEGEHEHARAGWIQCDCPTCSPNWSHFRLGYNLEGHYFNCWGCGPKQLTPTLIALTGAPYKEIKKFLEDFTVPELGERVERRGKLVLPKGLKDLDELPHHQRYLRERGFRYRDLVRLWGIQGLGHGKWSIFIPFQFRGETVSYTTRKINDKGRRYDSCPLEHEAMNAKELLYGEDYVRHSIIVVEGSIDVWSIGPGSAGIWGTGYTQPQLARIAKYPKRTLCFDSEPEAQERARQLMDDLSVFPGKTYNVVLSYKDANETLLKKPREIEQLRRRFLK